MNTPLHFVGIAGSLRKESFNRKLLNAIAEHLPNGATLEILEIGNMPLFNEDLENAVPETVLAFREKIKTADGIIIATPEYNRSIPGVLKNAIDWASRPYGQSSWKGKWVGVLGATPGNVGTALAQSHLKTTMLYQNAKIMGQPEFYLNAVHEKMDATGKITDPSTEEHVKSFIAAFMSHIGAE